LLDGTTETSASLARPKTAEITVTYHDFPPAAEAAFEAAAAIFETLLMSDAEILVTATWTPLDSPALARARSSFRTKDAVEDPDLPLADTAYPSALAGAFRGQRIDEVADLEVEVSSSFANWYFGTDGAPGAGKTDLVTAALHEMGHGFGFSTRATPAGFAGSNPTPTVYDRFVFSGTGKAITMMSVAELAAALTGNELFFGGTKTKNAAGGRGAALYAPALFAGAASVAHLAVPRLLQAMTDRLLGPAAFPGFALHDLGPIALAILSDIGWQIAGIGQPARFALNLVSNFWVEGQDHPMNIRVEVLDPLGDPVPGDNSSSVTLHLYATLGGDDDPGWICMNFVITKIVSAGVAVFPGCWIRGTGTAHFRAVGDGIATGWSPFMVVVEAVHRVRAPMLTR